MTEIRLEPTLSGCIETVAKREYERILSVLLKARDEDPRLAEELELLRLFLESADFGELRSRSDEFLLAGGRVEFRLRSTKEMPGYEIEMNPV
jgi:hypothetical protein